MNNPEIVGLRDSLDAVFALADGLTAGDVIQGHLTKYLCVRVAGFVEQSMRHLYFAHARNRSSRTVATFVSRQLGRPQNMTAARIRALAGYFDDAWRIDLETFITLERQSALNSLVTNRNRIAHGETTSFGLVQLKDWYKVAQEVIDQIEKLSS